MRILATGSVIPGMRLGREVLDTDGRVVLAAGIRLHSSYLRRLEQLGHASIYVFDEDDDAVLPELITEQTRRDVTGCIANFVSTGSIGKLTAGLQATPDAIRDSLARRVQKAADILINDVLSEPGAVIGLIELKSIHDYSFAHSVQVALTSIVIARDLGLDGQQLRELAIGALLHDSGKIVVPESIWTKPGRLTPAEFDHVKVHPRAGFDMVRRSRLGLRSAHIAFQHHERWDGTGYPRGLKGQGISLPARVCAVSDVFDAMTSDRPYKTAWHPSDALRTMTAEAGVLFDPMVVRSLCSVIAPYPVATSVRLTTGETAVVKRLNYRMIDRPVVTVIKDRDHRFHSQFRDIDLSRCDDVKITGPVGWYEC